MPTLSQRDGSTRFYSTDSQLLFHRSASTFSRTSSSRTSARQPFPTPYARTSPFARRAPSRSGRCRTLSRASSLSTITTCPASPTSPGCGQNTQAKRPRHFQRSHLPPLASALPRSRKANPSPLPVTPRAGHLRAAARLVQDPRLGEPGDGFPRFCRVHQQGARYVPAGALAA